MFAKTSLKLFGLLVITMLCLFATGCSSSKKGTGLDGLSEADLNAMREGRFGEGSIPMAAGSGMFKDVNFAYDSSALDEIARQNVEYNVQVLQANPGLRVQLEGHCDERGTAEYNMALGSQRAKSVFDIMVNYGVPASSMDTISYGEEIPLDPSQSEDAYAKNRRVHFSAYSQK